MEVLIQLKPALPQPTSWLANLLATAGPLSEEELCNRAPSLPVLFYLLNQLQRENWVDYVIAAGGKPVARVEPSRGDFAFAKVSVEPDRRYVFSRFALIRRMESHLIIESPLMHAKLIIQDSLRGISSSESVWTELLLSLGLLNAADEAEPDDLATWEFHDALFHWSTRSVHGDRKIGRTRRYQGKLRPPVTTKPPLASDVILLRVPERPRSDPPFSEILAQRKSVREHSSKPMALDDLAEFLYRIAKCRPYPSAGDIHELEFYIAINDCDGLDRGLYHYHDQRHALERLPARIADVEQQLANAAAAWNRDYAPQVLIILSARFGQVSWTYEQIAYRLVLLNAGVVIQTMYLVGTAMGLAGCALGFGDSDLFAQAAGLNPFVEGSVAEFALSCISPKLKARTTSS